MDYEILRVERIPKPLHLVAGSKQGAYGWRATTVKPEHMHVRTAFEGTGDPPVVGGIHVGVRDPIAASDHDNRAGERRWTGPSGLRDEDGQAVVISLLTRPGRGKVDGRLPRA